MVPSYNNNIIITITIAGNLTAGRTYLEQRHRQTTKCCWEKRTPVDAMRELRSMVIIL